MSLLSLSFWFNLRPGSMPVTARNILLAIAVILLVSAVIFFIMKRKKGFYKKIFINLYDFCVSNAFFGLLLLFFNYELVPFFSARFWFLIWGASAAVWLYYILKGLKEIPEKKRRSEEVDEIKKYLP